MRGSFEIITSLQYEVKALERRLTAFESGEKYVTMKEEHEKELRFLWRIIKKLRKELADARYELKRSRKLWYEATDDMQDEYEKKIDRLKKELVHQREQNYKLGGELDQAKDQITKLRREKYALGAELQEEKEKNLKLRAQLAKDFENSSLPSSAQKIRKKKIPNNREATGRRPGAQHGHPGHGRKRQEPDRRVHLCPDQDILNDPDFKKTKKTIRKQVVNIHVQMDVVEYIADVYYNSKTGERYHAPFPEGVTDDVNYGATVKAFLFLLNQDCCVSIDKCRDFLKNLTDGKLEISKGMINSLGKSFAAKSERQRTEGLKELLVQPVMHTDCTNVRVNGKNEYVFICAAPEGSALYYARQTKGHAGVAGTAVENYPGILVHDHERTFFSYGSAHQECLAHVLRYLKGSCENEPERKWNTQMRDLIREMIHYANGRNISAEPDVEKIREFEARYDKILRTAQIEYENVPCSDYYREGYNLYMRMKEYKDAHLLFLHDIRVPTTNNHSERLLRGMKRKQNQAMTFRSSDSLEALCDCMSVLFAMRQRAAANMYAEVVKVFA